MFLCQNLEELNNHHILSKLWGLSDYTSLLVYIIIKEKIIQEKRLAIIKNSKEEKEFVNKLKNRVSNIETANIYSHKTLEIIFEEFISYIKELWYKHARQVHITKHSKTW